MRPEPLLGSELLNRKTRRLHKLAEFSHLQNAHIAMAGQTCKRQFEGVHEPNRNVV